MVNGSGGSRVSPRRSTKETHAAAIVKTAIKPPGKAYFSITSVTTDAPPMAITLLRKFDNPKLPAFNRDDFGDHVLPATANRPAPKLCREKDKNEMTAATGLFVAITRLMEPSGKGGRSKKNPARREKLFL